jgi:2-polyprenyl-3-methyl-5-hydroxy-6-metoxy-1,4-benzoquinol methylase
LSERERMRSPTAAATGPYALAGREAELATVDALLDGLSAGWGGLLLITGEPGIGKTHLSEETVSRAAARGYRTVWASAARKNADAGVADRVRFEVADVTATPDSLGAGGAYDLVLAFEMIHDLARPQAALATMRHLVAPAGVCLVADENVAEHFEAPTDNPTERLFFAASVLHCLPVGMADAPSEATGTVVRPRTLRRYASEAGFSDVEVLPIHHDMFRFYRLVAP